jgi:hypothetical protein
VNDAGNLWGRDAGDLAGGGTTGDADAKGEALGTLAFAGVGLARCVGVEKKPSTPHARLAFVHLQCPFCQRCLAQQEG